MIEHGPLLVEAFASPTVPLLSPPRTIVSVLMLVCGGFLLKGGFTYWRTSRLIENTPTETVHSMAAGRTELKGEAVVDGEAMDEPFGGGDAVVATWEIATWFEGEDDEPGEWVTTARGTLAEPFLLDDGTGRVEVAATGDAEIHVSDENTSSVTVGTDETAPRSVQEFLVEHREEDLDPGDESEGMDGKHRYTQEVIPPGEDAYVFGDAVVRADDDGSTGDGSDGGETGGARNEQRLRVQADETTGRFVLADMAEEALSSGLRLRAPLVLVLGFVLTIVGFRLGLLELGIG